MRAIICGVTSSLHDGTARGGDDRISTWRGRAALAACVYTVLVVFLAFVEGLTTPSLPRSNIRFVDGAIHVNAIARGDLLDRAGVQAGDRIVGVAGRGLSSPFDLNSRLQTRRPGDVVELSVERDGRTLELPVEITVNLTLADAFRVGLPVCVLLGIGMAVFWVRPEVDAALLLLLFCLMSAINDSAQISFLVGRDWPQRVLTFAYTMTSLASGAVLLHLLLVFPVVGRAQRLFRPVLPLMYGIQLALGLNYFIPTVIPSATRWLSNPAVSGPLIKLFTTSVFACYALGFVSMAATLLTVRHPRVRAQAAVLAAGLGLLVVLQVTLVEIPLRVSGRVLVSAPGQCLFDLIVPGCVAVAIVGYRLFDINVLIRHGLVYTGASGLVAGFFVALMAVLGWLSDRLWHGPSGIALAIAAALAAILFHPARVWAQELVDRVLYRRRYSYRSTLTEAGERLAMIVETPAALEYVQSRIDAVLAPSWMEVLVESAAADGGFTVVDKTGRSTAQLSHREAQSVRRELEAQVRPFSPSESFSLDRWSGSAALVSPIVRGERRLGALVLGPRSEDIPYLPEDRDFVGTLVGMTGAVLESARLLEERSVRERLALLGTAASSMIHELKNPLGAMRSTLAVLRRRLRQDPAGLELTHIVDDEVERLKDRVMNVLTFVRPQNLPNSAVVATEVIRQLIHVVEHEFEKFDVEIRVQDDVGAAVVEGDAERLRQAFLNVLLNAREAMPDGGVITVRVQPSDGMVCVLFEDTGPGFQGESLDRAREPFFSTKTLGTGLGLSNVERVVHEHGGTLEIGNREPNGAWVRLLIPARFSGA